MVKNNDNKPVIREGQEGGPLTTKKESDDEKAYPRKSTKDVQHDNQPEFLEEDNGKEQKPDA